MKKLRDSFKITLIGSQHAETTFKMLQISSHVQSKQHFARYFKVCKLQERAEQFMELFNLFELKILGYYLRVFRSSREFLLPPLILAELCLGAYHGQPSEAVSL